MTAPHQEPAAPMGANPGETLRTAREGKGWTLAAVAQQLNLTERALARIEAGDFSQLPGHTFARGYVRAYAKLLGLDQNRLVQEFDQHTGTNASGSSVNSLGRIEEPGRLSRNVMRFFGLALLLVLAGAAFYWWQERSMRQESAPAVTALERIEVESADGTTEVHELDRPEEPLEQGAESQQESPLALGEPDAEPASGQTAPQAPASAPGAEAPQSLPLVPAENTAGEPAAAAAQPAESTAPAAPLAAGEGRLEMNFSADCWTRVTDADGRVLFSALAKAGSSRTVTGKAPFDVHLGFARGAQLTFNGEAVNLASHTRGETARLKLGQ